MSHRPVDVWNLAVELTNMEVANTDVILELDPKTLKVTVVENEKSGDPKKLRMKALYKTGAGPLKILPEDWLHWLGTLVNIPDQIGNLEPGESYRVWRERITQAIADRLNEIAENVDE